MTFPSLPTFDRPCRLCPENESNVCQHTRASIGQSKKIPQKQKLHSYNSRVGIKRAQNESATWEKLPRDSIFGPALIHSGVSPEEADILEDLLELGSTVEELEVLRCVRQACSEMATANIYSFCEGFGTQLQTIDQKLELLRVWFYAHILDPYPTQKDRRELSKLTGLSQLQIKNFFCNFRKRHFIPVLVRNRPPRSHIEVLMLAVARMKRLHLRESEGATAARTLKDLKLMENTSSHAVDEYDYCNPCEAIESGFE